MSPARRSRFIAVATIAFILLSIVLSIVILASFRSIGARLDAQNREIARNREIIESQRRQIAGFKSSDLYLMDALIGTSDFMSRFAAGYEQIKGRPTSTQMLQTVYYQGAGAALLSRLNEAAFARKQARSPDDQRRVEQLYQAVATETAGRLGGIENDGWAARAQEGVAYARLQRGDLAAADAAIREATRLDPHAAVVGTTRLKIACARRDPPEAIRADLARLRAVLDGEVARTRSIADPTDIVPRNARLERDYVEKDDELFLLCEAAGIAPRPAAA